MNDKIKELALQAGFQHINDEGIGWAGNHNASLPKFAELIIQECIKQVEKNYVGAIGTYAGAHNSATLKCKKSIQKHFEVTE